MGIRNEMSEDTYTYSPATDLKILPDILTPITKVPYFLIYIYTPKDTVPLKSENS
jgi:hypothetical protein